MEQSLTDLRKRQKSLEEDLNESRKRHYKAKETKRLESQIGQIPVRSDSIEILWRPAVHNKETSRLAKDHQAFVEEKIAKL